MDRESTADCVGDKLGLGDALGEAECDELRDSLSVVLPTTDTDGEVDGDPLPDANIEAVMLLDTHPLALAIPLAEKLADAQPLDEREAESLTDAHPLTVVDTEARPDTELQPLDERDRKGDALLDGQPLGGEIDAHEARHPSPLRLRLRLRVLLVLGLCARGRWS